MTLTSRQKVLWLAIAGVGPVVLVLLLCPAKPQQPLIPDLRISGPPQVTNGVMFVSILLSNGSSRTLNIVDDGAGNPFFVLDVGRSKPAWHHRHWASCFGQHIKAQSGPRSDLDQCGLADQSSASVPTPGRGAGPRCGTQTSVRSAFQVLSGKGKAAQASDSRRRLGHAPSLSLD